MRKVILFAAFVALAACGTSVPEVTTGEPISYSEHLEPLIIKRCLGCHTADEPEAELVLEEGEGYSQLVGRSSVQVPALKLVAEGDADASYLWQKLDHSATKGQGMPRTLFGSKRLPEAELAFIRRWIEDGARP
jgi:hypothetical protein